MRSGWTGISFALVVMTVLTASPASATSITYFLNQSGTGPVGTAGTITLDDAGADSVDILVTLNEGYGFVKTGAGDALAFNILGDPVITIDGITAGFAIGPEHEDESPFGTFHYSVSCTTGCGNGGSQPNLGPLSFDVHLTGITVDSFIANSDGYYFASDVIGPGADGVPLTGNVAANGLVITKTDVTPVPEPTSLVLLGSGLIGSVYKWRRKRRQGGRESI
jgi:hypothetical protein